MTKGDGGRGRGRGSGVTVSGVHAASCLAASENPASDKHGLRHATNTRGGVGQRGGGTEGRDGHHRYRMPRCRKYRCFHITLSRPRGNEARCNSSSRIPFYRQTTRVPFDEFKKKKIQSVRGVRFQRRRLGSPE